MTEPAPSLDELLTAYLDDALDPTQQAELEHRLAQDAEARDRLDRLARVDTVLPPVGKALLSDAPPMPELDSPRPAHAPNQLAWAATLMIGVALGWFIATDRGPRDLDDWRDFAAAYHALYTPETLGGPPLSDTAAALQLGLVSETLGRSLIALDEIEGLEFRRAQVLGHDGHNIIQLAYLTESGIPVALCIMEDQAAASPAAQAMRQGIPSISWGDGENHFLLLGQDGITDLQPMAASFIARL